MPIPLSLQDAMKVLIEIARMDDGSPSMLARQFLEKHGIDCGDNLWHVVRGCNYGYSGERPGHDECFITSIPLSIAIAQQIADKCNLDDSRDSSHYFRAVPSHYRLLKFEP